MAKPGRTLEQKLAEAEAVAARLRTKINQARRKAETREKIIVGGTVLAAIKDDAHLRQRVVALLREKVTREIDREAIAELLASGSPTPENGTAIGQRTSPSWPSIT